jgi:DNA polymerase III subunit epsilon
MTRAVNFTAIDFETANGNRDSACQLAAVIVRKGAIVDQAMWMIRPVPMYFSPGNIRIHGITPSRVANEPVFGDLWSDIAAKIGNDCLVAHNASFDIGVLRACLMRHRCDTPEMQYTCTRAIARRTWPHRHRFGLKPLAEWLGIRFQHHDALEDSIACAKILLAAGVDQQAQSLEELEKKLNLSRGTAGDWGQSGPAARRRSTSAGRSPSMAIDRLSNSSRTAETKAGYLTTPAIPPIDLQRLLIRAEFIRPLSGKRIVFAGRFRDFSRTQADTLASRLGGQTQDEIDEAVDLVVVGKMNPEDGNIQAEVDRINQSGAKIRVVDEEGFLGLMIADR